MTYSVNTIQ